MHEGAEPKLSIKAPNTSKRQGFAASYLSWDKLLLCASAVSCRVCRVLPPRKTRQLFHILVHSKMDSGSAGRVLSSNCQNGQPGGTIAASRQFECFAKPVEHALERTMWPLCRLYASGSSQIAEMFSLFHMGCPGTNKEGFQVDRLLSLPHHESKLSSVFSALVGVQ